MRLLVALILTILAGSCFAAGPSDPIFLREYGETTSVSATDPVTVSTVAKYTEGFLHDRSEFLSVSLCIETTETVAVAIELEHGSVDASGTTTWQSFDPPIVKNITTDYNKTWGLSHFASEKLRLKFPVCTSTNDSRYLVKHAKLNRFRKQ